MSKLHFKKLSPEATQPKKAKEGDAGFDLTAISINETNDYIEYGTGIAVEIPAHHVGLLFPRSSVTNKNLLLKNSVGVIDSGYRGELKFRYLRLPDATGSMRDNIYSIGERIGQLIIMELPHFEMVEVNELSDSERGTGGYGSSGN
jgi:dUTP pyrophosphatase